MIICDLTQFDVFPVNKTMLVKKFFRVISRVVWFCFFTLKMEIPCSSTRFVQR